MNFDIEYIEKLAKIITDTSLTEISIEDGDQAITLRKDLPPVSAVAAAPVVSAPVAASASATPQAPAEAHKGNAITSPMVGTFYSAPSPDAEPFVKVGQDINKGTKVCIIEAMKLMNEIESEYDGEIAEICVNNEDVVEYGKPLFKIK